jgi:acetolactate synthase-1/2/3 large subunit
VLDVDVVFGLPGVHNLSVWEALRASSIRLVGVRHEQAAVYAADGYARVTGRLGVAVTTTGPGAANAVAATGEAFASHSPVLVIATDIAKGLRKPGVLRGVLHETSDQAAFFGPVTKDVVLVDSAEDLPQLVLDAGLAALEAPTRPVYLQVPTDLLKTAVTDPEAPEAVSSAISRSEMDLEPAIELLRESQRPLIWAGGGAVDAVEPLGAFAVGMAAPVIETFMGRGAASAAPECAVGMPPHLPEVGQLWDEADLVVAIGSDFDGMMTQNWQQPTPPRMLAINVDAADATKNYDADVVIECDASHALRALVPRLDARDGLSDLQARLTQLRADAWERLTDEDPISVEFLSTIAEAVPADAAVICDMCIPGYWIGGFHDFSGPRRLAYPVGWGTLGFALPASIGSACSDLDVLAVCGDGGFLFAAGELATIRQEELNLKLLIVDDGGYGMLRFDQQQAGLPTFGVDLVTPDFAALAAAFGIPVEEVADVGDPLRDALRRAFGKRGPRMIVLKAQMRPPPTTSPRWYRRVAP